MPKVDITKTSGNSKMPELKKVRPKGQPKSKMPSLNASSVHHSGDVKVTEIVSSETIETENGTETRTESLVIKEPVNQPEDIEEEKFELEEKKDEPELVENLDNFEEEKDDFDMEIKEEKMPKKAKKGKKKLGKGISIISKTIFFLFSLSGVLLLATILSIGFLPENYIVCLIGIFAFLFLLFGIFTFSKKFKRIAKSISIFFEIVFIIIFCIAFFYIDKTTGFVSEILAGDYQIEKYYIIVKTDSTFQNLEDLDGHSIAIYDDTISENYQKALDEFSKKSSAEQKKFEDFSDASFAFLRNETDALFLKGSLKSTAEEIVTNYNTQNPDTKIPAFNDQTTKILDTIEVKFSVKQTSNNTDLTTEPFNIFISGIDTYGDISLVSRSDVNMIATVNPKTHKILLTSIPRDYYVQLHNTSGLKDKLTHAGLYGVDKSRETLEDLFSTKIDYYVRVNFSSVEKIVDAIGGITIKSEYALSLAPLSDHAGQYCDYSIGENYVYGDCALRFARERHSYTEGDNYRIKNQQEVLDAIIKKISSSKTIISNYSELLSALSGNVETNISSNQIYKLVQAQLREMPSWEVDRITVDGEGALDYTYSIPSQLLYVAIPDESTIETAKQKINEVLNAN